MFTTRKLIQSVLVAATIAVTAPAHADASFATGGYERFEPALSAPGSAVPAASEASFANGGYARFARETQGAITEPTHSVGTGQALFATGGYARHLPSDASPTDTLI